MLLDRLPSTRYLFFLCFSTSEHGKIHRKLFDVHSGPIYSDGTFESLPKILKDYKCAFNHNSSLFDYIPPIATDVCTITSAWCCTLPFAVYTRMHAPTDLAYTATVRMSETKALPVPNWLFFVPLVNVCACFLFNWFLPYSTCFQCMLSASFLCLSPLSSHIFPISCIEFLGINCPVS